MFRLVYIAILNSCNIDKISRMLSCLLNSYDALAINGIMLHDDIYVIIFVDIMSFMHSIHRS